MGASYYVFFYGKNESKEKVEEEKKIDDRISPLETQSVAMEIHRIRKKGIVDGICERCGTRDMLVKFNGMRICVSCRDSL